MDNFCLSFSPLRARDEIDGSPETAGRFLYFRHICSWKPLTVESRGRNLSLALVSDALRAQALHWWVYLAPAPTVLSITLLLSDSGGARRYEMWRRGQPKKCSPLFPSVQINLLSDTVTDSVIEAFGSLRVPRSSQTERWEGATEGGETQRERERESLFPSSALAHLLNEPFGWWMLQNMMIVRSEARRVWKECLRLCRSGCSTLYYKKQPKLTAI